MDKRDQGKKEDDTGKYRKGEIERHTVRLFKNLIINRFIQKNDKYPI